ncbi:MAG: hypothetical protein M3463_17415 [Verrucomicrobiota bacterium]|nr:hypothetical protein [Verrucomicrobiota bacterium]
MDLILWEHWDPIGVNDTPTARHEYSGYVPSVVRLLASGADAFKLAEHLYFLEHASMTCVTDAQHRNRVVEKLLNAYHAYA